MLSKFSVKKPYTVVVAVILVIILGVVSFTDMTVDLLPSMNMPYAIVSTTYIGASPEQVEDTVTKPVESAMATISNIKNVSSVSQENVSVVILEFEQTANMDSITIEMRESLDQLSASWPDTVGNSTIMRINPDMLPVMVAAVSIDDTEITESSRRIEEEIIPELERLEGVASITTSGNVEEHIEVAVDEQKVKSLNGKMEKELDKKFKEAEKALSDAKKEVEKGKKDLEAAQKKASKSMGDAEAQLAKKEAELNQGLLEIKEKKQELAKTETELDAKIDSMMPTLTSTEADLKKQKSDLEQLKKNEDTIKASYQQVLDAIAAGGETEELLAQKTALETQIGTISKYDTLMKSIEGGLDEVAKGKKQLTDSKAQIQAGKKQLESTEKQLKSGAISLAEARGTLTSKEMESLTQMNGANIKVSLGEQKLNDQSENFNTTKEQAYDNADLTKILTVDMVKNLLKAQNFNMPAGYVEEENVKYLIRVGDQLTSVEELQNMILVDMEGIDPITLADVARVEKVNDSEETYAKLNGQSGVTLSIQKQTGYSTGDVSKRLLEKMESLEKEYKEVEIVTLMDQGVYIDLIVDSVLENLLMGAVLAILILFLFLRDIRPTFVIACSIPISLLAAIVLMYFSGVTLNIISLSGLALGVGMLVDNSIVVIENIYRMRNEGVPAKKAAIEGAKQVAGAIAASTLTTVCVFAPIVFVKGMTRQLFVDMGLTIAYSLLASLVVALTLVPMLAAGVLRKSETKESRFFSRIQRGYGTLLEKALRHKGIVLIGSLVIFVLSGVLSLSRGTAFMPEMESNQISMTLTTEKGTSFEDTTKAADEVMDRLMQIPDIQDVGAMASTSSFSLMGGSSGSSISIYAILKDNPSMDNAELQKRIEKDTKDVKCELDISMSNMDMSALGSSGVVVQVEGRDMDTLQQVATDVAQLVEKVEGTTDVSDGMEETTEEFRIIVDKKKASAYNLTVAQIYQEIASGLQQSGEATTLTTEEGDYAVNVVDEKKNTTTRDAIRKMIIETKDQDGKTNEVKLSQLVTFEEGVGMQAISRTSQKRYIQVSAQIAEGENVGLVSDKVERALEKYEVPEGYSVEMAGENETIMESMKELMKMLALAIVFMYLIMVAQFQSLKSPFIIMFTIPLAFTGGFLGLWLAGFPVSVISVVGFVMLAGIIVNNGIVFVDYANQLIEQGRGLTEALVETGKTRLRPIIMTALTTVLGLLTMSMGVGQGADMVQPMAIVTVGGLIYGTILTLFVVPCIYAMFNKRKLEKKKRGKKHE